MAHSIRLKRVFFISIKGSSSNSVMARSSGDVAEASSVDVSAKETRKKLALGVNEVMRALERNELRLVVVCKEVKPVSLVQHIPIAAHVRDVPICTVPDAGLILGQTFGLRTLAAIGFKNCVDSSIDAVVSLALSIAVPSVISWVPRGIALGNNVQTPIYLPQQSVQLSYKLNAKNSRKAIRQRQKEQKKKSALVEGVRT
mmetsp:Transcript_30050/g.48560  ORF Transcript_30050/g.48560 Transcript_30050/m.48560 type:complete len:200 (-) Transcript_30050:328-927(-)